MRSLYAILVGLCLGACGGGEGEGPHDVIACDVIYPAAPPECERACAKTPSGDGTCVIDFPGTVDPNTGKPVRGECNVLFVAEYEGQRGCCAASGAAQPVRFVECL